MRRTAALAAVCAVAAAEDPCGGAGGPDPSGKTSTCSSATSSQEIAQAHGSDMTGKVAFGTGFDSGIGYNTAVALAGLNATIVIASLRPDTAGAEAAANITRDTGNAKVEVVGIDLSSFASVRATAKAVLAKHPVIDTMVCDAGIGGRLAGLPDLTDDGFERVIQVDYLGHFLLVDLFLPALRASSAARVVHVVSELACDACSIYKMPDDCASFNSSMAAATANYSSTSANNYGIAKKMMSFHARELTRREKAQGSNVVAYAARPGLVDTPLGNADIPKWVQAVMCLSVKYKPCPIPAPNGAATPTYLAVAPLPASAAGEMFFFCDQVPPPTGWADADQQTLFDQSLAWTHASL